MNTKQSSMRQRVKHLMWLDQRARDDDRYLILKLWESEGLVLTKQQRTIYMGLSSANIIVRRRQEFSKDYPASPLANHRRYHAFKELTEEFSSGNWFKKLMHRKGI